MLEKGISHYYNKNKRLNYKVKIKINCKKIIILTVNYKKNNLSYKTKKNNNKLYMYVMDVIMELNSFNVLGIIAILDLEKLKSV